MDFRMPFLLFVIFVVVAKALEEDEHYTNVFSVELKSNDIFSADEIAQNFGFINEGEILPGERIFKFIHRDVRSVHSEAHIFEDDIGDHQDVLEVVQQVAVKKETKAILRKKRKADLPFETGIQFITSDTEQFNDPLWNKTWHLNPRHQDGMNIQAAWDLGATGKGILIVHLDSGIDYNHPEFKDAYDAYVSKDIPGNDTDAFGGKNSSHGTSMAGLSSARANNKVCSLGIAYEAKVGMIKQFDGYTGSVTDIDEANSLWYNNENVGVYVIGSGPSDKGYSIARKKPLEKKALERGVKEGRNGKGFIYVFPPGNGGIYKDSCGFDLNTNQMETLSINAAGEMGSVPRYAENCTGVIASAYSSGRYPEGYMVTAAPEGSCTDEFTGTSSSAAISGGVMAVLLSANPELTWRDVQHLIINHARSKGFLTDDADWIVNAAGLRYSRSFGFGLMDVGGMVAAAQTWNSVPEQKMCNFTARFKDKVIVEDFFEFDVDNCDGISKLEHVLVTVSIDARRRGEIEAHLKSAQDTEVMVIQGRPYDFSIEGFRDWQFLDMAHWGENPVGKWTLRVFNKATQEHREEDPIVMKRFTLTLYGTKD